MSLVTIGIRKFNILKQFINKIGEYIKVGFIRNDLYNISSREKRKLIAKK
jgi:hypothetical protein